MYTATPLLAAAVGTDEAISTTPANDDAPLGVDVSHPDQESEPSSPTITNPVPEMPEASEAVPEEIAESPGEAPPATDPLAALAASENRVREELGSALSQASEKSTRIPVALNIPPTVDEPSPSVSTNEDSQALHVDVQTTRTAAVPNQGSVALPEPVSGTTDGSETIDMSRQGVTDTANSDQSGDVQTRMLNPTPSAPLEGEQNTQTTVTANYNRGKAAAMAQFQTTTPGMVPPQLTGTEALNRALNWSASYNPASSLTMSASGSDTGLPGDGGIRTTANADDTQQKSRTYTLDFHQPGLPTMTLQRNTNETTQASHSRFSSSSTSDTLNSTWSKGQFNAALNLQRATYTNRQPRYSDSAEVGVAGADSPAEYSNTADTASLALGYQPNEKVNLGVNLSANSLTANNDGEKSTTKGRSIQASATYQPKENLTYTANLSTTLSDPVQSASGIVAPSQENQNLALGMQWQPNKDLDVAVNVSSDRSKTGKIDGVQTFDATDTNAGDTGETSNNMQTTSVNVAYHPNERVDFGVNMSANRSVADGYGSHTTSGMRSLQANARVQPSKDVTVSANLLSNKVDPTESTSGFSTPAQTQNLAGVRADWQVSKNVSANVGYTTQRFDSGEYGSNSSSTVSAGVGWKNGEKTAVNTYIAQQQVNDPNLSGSSKNHLVGVGAKFSPVRNTTVSVDVQQLSGTTSEGVSQLLYTEAQSARSESATANSQIGIPVVTDNKLTRVSGSINYALADKHDIALTGEMLQGSGQSGARQSAVGIGWHYHADDDLTFALDARRVSYSDSNSGSAIHDNQLSASLNFTF